MKEVNMEFLLLELMVDIAKGNVASEQFNHLIRCVLRIWEEFKKKCEEVS